MLALKKIVLVTASVALALGSISAKDHSKATPSCAAPSFPTSVEGVGTFCQTGQACVGNTSGQCPGPQTGLPHGAYCAKIHTGVFGCRPIDPPKKHDINLRIRVSTSVGETPAMTPVDVVVEGDSSDDSSEWEDDVAGDEEDSSDDESSDVPVAKSFANLKNAESPPPPGQFPTPTQTTSKPTPKPPTDDPDSPPPVTLPPGFKRDSCSEKGMNKVYVMFHSGVYFCVSGTPCGGSKKGACPGPGRYAALPKGSYCFEYLANDYRCAANV